LFLSTLEKKIVFRYLFSHKKGGFISFFALFSFLGIMLGVATLIIVMSVMNGFRENLLTSIIGMRPHIVGLSKQEKFPLNKEDINSLQRHKEIIGIYPMIEKQNILSFKGQAQGVLVQAMDPSSFMSRSPLITSLTAGDIKDFKGYNIFIGQQLSKDFNIKINDRLLLMTPEGTETAFGTIPRQRSFTVCGIFSYGMHDYDKNYIFMPLDTAQSFYNLKDEIGHLGIFIGDINRAHALVKNLNKEFFDKYYFIDWKHQDQSIFHAVEVEKNVMFLILTLIILIAGFNITSSLIMLVKDKTKSIGILKTMGVTHASIGRIFISIGLLIGGIGTLFGVFIGILVVKYIENIRHFLETLMNTELFSAEIYYLTKLPAVLSWPDVLGVCTISVILSFLASFFPARTAIKMNVVEAITS
jgi:lipoprotein-releasing system permease protein